MITLHRFCYGLGPPNRMRDPDVEVSVYSAWGAFRSSLSVDATVAHGGSRSLKVVSTTDTQVWGAFSRSQIQEFGNGRRYDIGAWVRSDYAGLKIQVYINLMTSAGVSFLETANKLWTLTDTNWTYITINSAYVINDARVGCAGIDFYVASPYPPLGTAFWIDDVKIERLA